MNLINIIIRNVCGKKIKDMIIVGHGRCCVKEHLKKVTFDKDHVVEAFIYNCRWTQLDVSCL